MTMDNTHNKQNKFDNQSSPKHGDHQPYYETENGDIQMNADAKLLAHALDEHDLLSEADQSDIESRLADDPDARAYVDEMRQIGKELQTALIESETQLEPLGDTKAATEARLSQNEAQSESLATAQSINKNSPDPDIIKVRWIQLGLVASLGLVLTILFLPVFGKARSPEPLSSAMSAGSGDIAHGSTNDDVLFERSPLAHAPMPTAAQGQVQGHVQGHGQSPGQLPLAFNRGNPPLGIETPSKNPQAPPQQILAQQSMSSKLGNGLYTNAIANDDDAAYESHESPSNGTTHLGAEAYDGVTHNPFLKVAQAPLSTFSIDVDTASYANVRRFLSQGQLPPPGAVRLEEMINYFNYEDKAPDADSKHPFAVHMEVNQAPWQKTNRLVRIGIKGRVIDDDKRPSCNLVFLLDVSGSMSDYNKLPLVKQSLKLLLSTLNEKDRVAIVVYAGSSGLVLGSTPASDRHKIMESLNRLNAGGSTNGGEGIRLAYQIAAENFIDEGVNRVILATDGDFNVGTTNRSDLERLIERNRESGISLSILGFGMGNYKDGTMESLSNKGNGNYAYIDTIHEAQKSLVDQASGTLVTIAKDVKIQVEFNPAHVTAYRLIGYENRMLRKEDFNNDRIDAGDIGAGHHVTALYEIVPTGQRIPVDTSVDPLKYQKPAATETKPDAGTTNTSPEMLTVKLRYKQPDGSTSTKLEFPLVDPDTSPEDASHDFRFAAAVANFGMILRGTPYRGKMTPLRSAQNSIALATAARGRDPHGYRSEFISMVQKALPLLRLLEMEAQE